LILFQNIYMHFLLPTCPTYVTSCPTYARVDVLTALQTKIMVLRDTTPCSVVDILQCFRGNSSLILLF
jgi:hypothetical protein